MSATAGKPLINASVAREGSFEAIRLAQKATIYKTKDALDQAILDAISLGDRKASVVVASDADPVLMKALQASLIKLGYAVTLKNSELTLYW
jgi:hypothetical protein